MHTTIVALTLYHSSPNDIRSVEEKLQSNLPGGLRLDVPIVSLLDIYNFRLSPVLAYDVNFDVFYALSKEWIEKDKWEYDVVATYTEQDIDRFTRFISKRANMLHKERPIIAIRLDDASREELSFIVDSLRDVKFSGYENKLTTNLLERMVEENDRPLLIYDIERRILFVANARQYLLAGRRRFRPIDSYMIDDADEFIDNVRRHSSISYNRRPMLVYENTLSYDGYVGIAFTHSDEKDIADMVEYISTIRWISTQWKSKLIESLLAILKSGFTPVLIFMRRTNDFTVIGAESISSLTTTFSPLVLFTDDNTGEFLREIGADPSVSYRPSRVVYEKHHTQRRVASFYEYYETTADRDLPRKVVPCSKSHRNK